MMNPKMLIQEMLMADHAIVRDGYIASVRADKKRIETLKVQLHESGFIPITESEILTTVGSEVFLSDGRRAVTIAGILWAVPKEFHEAAVRNAAIKEKMQRTKDDKNAGTVNNRNFCTEIVDGLLCGGPLRIKGQCPSSTLGIHGVSATAICEVCGHTFAIMR